MVFIWNDSTKAAKLSNKSLLTNMLPTTIKTVTDITVFFSHLYDVEKVGFHPEDDFENYADESGQPTYAPEQAEVRNRLMSECYDVCDAKGIDPCAIANLEFRKRYMELFQD